MNKTECSNFEKIEFFPYNSIKFREAFKYLPYFVMREGIVSTDWLGSRAMIVTYPATADDVGIRKRLEKRWKELAWSYSKKFSSEIKVTVKPDIEVSQEELSVCSFFIYNAPSNRIFSEHVKDRFPIMIQDRKIVVEDDCYEGDNLLLSITIPNPFNPHRFFAIYMLTSNNPLFIYDDNHLLNMGEYVIMRYPRTIEYGLLDYSDTHSDKVYFKLREKDTDDTNWVCTTSEHFVFSVRPGSLAEKDIRYLIHIHETAYMNTNNTLGIEPYKDKFLCYIYENKKELGDWSGVASPGINMICTVYNDEMKEEYAGFHEVVHTLTDKYWGHEQPYVWSEGLAVLLSWDKERPVEFFVAEILYSRRLKKLSHLLEDDNYKRVFKDDVCWQFASLIKFLVRKYGWKRFSDMIRRISKKPSKAMEIFEYVYNTPFLSIEKEWSRYIIDYYRYHKKEIEEWRPLHSIMRHFFYYGDFRKFLSDIEVSIERNGNDPHLYYLAGESHFYMGNLKTACKYFVKALSLPILRKKYEWVYRHSYLYLGRTHDLIGERDMAINYYNHVLQYPEYDNTHDRARELLKTPYRKDLEKK